MWQKFLEKLLNKILNDLTSRKWLAFLIVMTFSFIGLLKDKISALVWGGIVTTSLGLFSTTNVVQKIKAGKTNGNGSIDVSGNGNGG